MKKEPYVYANLQLHYKHPPEEYLGVVSENWGISPTQKVALHVLLWGLISKMTMFYYETMQDVPIDEINNELQEVIRLLTNNKIKEE